MPESNHATTTVSVKENTPSGPRSALILYGSETGNAQDVAEEVGRLTEKLHFESLVLDLDAVQLRDLLRFTIVIFVVSTAGQGEFPQNARSVWKALLSGALKPGILRKLRFTSFGLGDSSYPRYNVAHRMLHGRLIQLGASSFCDRGEGNEQHPEGHSAGLREWIVQLRVAILAHLPLLRHLSPVSDDAFVEPRFSLKLKHIEPLPTTVPERGEMPSAALLPIRDGFTADIVENRRMTSESHFQDVRLYDLRLEHNYEYGPGAVAVVYPKNFPEDVQSFIDLMSWNDIADKPLELVQRQAKTDTLQVASPLRHFQMDNVQLSIRWLLENALDIMSIPRRSFFAALTYFARTDNDDQAYQKERLLELANPELIDELWDYTTRPKRTILEVMMDFTTIEIPWQYVLTTLPIMRGRQFSIASGGLQTKDDSARTRVQLLVAIVDPPSPIIKWRRRYGVCTRYMLSLKSGQQIRIQMQPGYLDVRRTELSTPVIMIGPGTGIAPMRSMIHQRLLWAQEADESCAERLNKDILFFGCRHNRADHFFHQEWEELVQKEQLQVYTAFSRDETRPKQYVQDLIREHAQIVAQTILDHDGKVYICGSSGNMPKGVRAALLDAVRLHDPQWSQDDAEAYLDAMENTGRYKQETW